MELKSQVFFAHDTQKHPDFPKKPLTPYFRFFMEKRAKYAKLHPEMSNLDLTKILSKKYRELPDKKKVRQKQMLQSMCLILLPFDTVSNKNVAFFSCLQKKYVEDFLRDKESFVHSMMKFRWDD